MHSNDLESQGVGNWVRLAVASKNEVLANAPDRPATYVIRKGVPFGRLQGESDIFYIGSAEGSLRQRLRGYFEPGSTQATNQRIYSEMEKHPDLELGFAPTSSSGLAKVNERTWLVEYKRDHGELPPLNRSMPGER